MSKLTKGSKLNLADFHRATGTAADERDALPTAPSGRVEAQRDFKKTTFRRDEDSGGFGDRRDRRPRRDAGDDNEGGEGDNSSRADEASAWRRSGDDGQNSRRDNRDSRSSDRPSDRSSDRPSDRSSDRPSDRRFGGDRGDRNEENGSESMRADSASEWRRPASSDSTRGSSDSVRGPSSRPDDAEWRSFSRDREFDRDRDSNSRFPRGNSSDNRPRYSDRDERSRDSESRYGGDSDRSGADSDRRRNGRYGDRESGRDSDRGTGRYERGGRRSDLPDDNSTKVDQRPSHLRLKLKRSGADGDAPENLKQESHGDNIKPESSLDRMEREVSAKRVPFNDEIDSSKKVADLAPIRLNQTRKTVETSNNTDRLEPQHTPAPVAAPALLSPAPAIALVPTADRYSADILKPVVPVSQKANPLEIAISERVTVNEKELNDGLSRLTISNSKRSVEVGEVIVKSMIENKVTITSVVNAVQSKPPNEQSQILVGVLTVFRKRKGDEELLDLIHKSGVDILPLLSDSAHLDEFLSRHHLLILKPVTADLSVVVQDLLKNHAASSIIISELNKLVDPSLPIPTAAKLIVNNLSERVFANKASPEFSVYTSFGPLLIRVLNESGARKAAIFSIQSYWFTAGGSKGQLKEALETVLKTKAISAVDLIAWRDDLKDKTPGKPKALLQVNSWIRVLEDELKAAEKKAAIATGEVEEEEEEEEDDDEEDYEDD